MKKMVLILFLILSLIFGFIINKTDKKIKEKNNKNVSIVIEKEDGNIKINNFPEKEKYEYLKTECEKSNNTNVTPTFNEENWKLNIKANSNSKIDGNFNCAVYFKEKEKTAADYIKERVGQDGIIKLDQPATAQTPAQIEYRYSKSNLYVRNYITFNNEKWRIIGVFNVDDGTGKTSERLKLIRETSIGDYSWDTSASSVNSGSGVNQWGETTKSDGTTYEGADLMRLLNPGYSGTNGSLYWNKTSGTCYYDVDDRTTSCNFTSTGLSEEAKSMIDNAKWNLAASDYNQTTPNAFISERGTTVGAADTGISITKTNNWIGKVGLMNASDYGYASSECYNNNTILLRYDECTSSNWLYNWGIQWTLMPNSYSNHDVFYAYSTGFVNDYSAYKASGVRPVIYLKSSVKITSGTGTSSDPYKVS